MSRLGPADRVLVRLPSWLGDFVMAEPVVRAIHDQLSREGRPEDLTLAGPAAFFELFDGRFEGAARAVLPELPSDWRGHDVALFLNGSSRSPWTAVLAGIPVRVGRTGGARGLLLTESITPARERGRLPLGIGRAGRGRRTLPRPFTSVAIELAGVLGIAVPGTAPRIVPTAAALECARARRAECDVAGEFIVACVGARPGSSKGYPADAWARALDELAADRTVLLIGGPGEEDLVQAVGEATRNARSARLLDPVADLAELAAHCSEARLVLSTDGGSRHVARAVGAPQVVVFGPTDPRHTGLQAATEVAVRQPVDCGPCHLELCPQNGAAHGACMRLVTPERVAVAAQGLLARSSR
jgi:heptosyltransferase II